MVLEEKGEQNLEIDNTEQEPSLIQKDKEVDHQCIIAMTAYYKAENRGFVLEQELVD